MESRPEMSGLGPLYPTVTTSSRLPRKAWTTRISRKVELLLEPAAAPGKHSAATAGKSPAKPYKHGAIWVALAARRPIQAAPAARAASRCSMQKANFSSESAISARESAISPQVFSEYFPEYFPEGDKKRQNLHFSHVPLGLPGFTRRVSGSLSTPRSSQTAGIGA